MINGNMANRSTYSLLKSSLLISAGFALVFAPNSAAQSNDPFPDVVVPGSSANSAYGSIQSLPGLSPDVIAADVTAKYDPLTGRTEYTAQDFDPFEQENKIAGTAQLRSALSGISRDGANVSGGAYLDITVLYTSQSRDPWDGKRLEHAVFMNGQPVDVMTYDIQAVDCQSDVTYVTYDDSYYQGASYGYLGGLYRPFPRYRGASRYYRECDQIRYGQWRGLRDRYTGYTGYDNRYNGRRGSRDRGLGTGGRQGNPFVGGNQGQNSNENSIDQTERERQLDLLMRMRETGITSRTVISSDRLGETRLSNTPDPLPPRPISSESPQSSERQSGRRGRGVLLAPIGNRAEELRAIRESGARAGVPRLGNATPRLSTPRSSIPSPTKPNSNTPIRRTMPVNRGASRPSENRASRERTRTKPQRSIPKTPVNRSAPPPRRESTNRSRPKPQRSSAPKPQRSSAPKPRRSSSPPKTQRMNRSFGGRNTSPPRSRRYYSGGTQTDRYEQTGCIKEERITLHISAERLEAARFDGLSIALLDQNGDDIPLYIPPNYIEGFSKANPYLGHYRSGIPQVTPDQTPRSSPAVGGYPTNPIQ